MDVLLDKYLTQANPFVNWKRQRIWMHAPGTRELLFSINKKTFLGLISISAHFLFIIPVINHQAVFNEHLWGHRFHCPTWKLKFGVTSWFGVRSIMYHGVWFRLIWHLCFWQNWDQGTGLRGLLLRACLLLNWGSLNLRTEDIWVWMGAAGEGSPVRGWKFSSISDFYPLDANNTPTPAVTAKTVPRRGQMSPCGGGRWGWGGVNCPLLRATSL